MIATPVMATPAMATPAMAGQDGEQATTPPVGADLQSARDAVLEADVVTDELFEAMIRAAAQEQTARGLPSFRDDPEAAYTERIAGFRREVYGPLFEDAEALAFLRRSAASVPAGFSFVPATAQTLLADFPSAEHLAVLHEGLRASRASSTGGGGSRVRSSTTLPRQLGRILSALRGSEEEATRVLVAEVVGQLREDAQGDEPRAAGAAIEALHSAGETGQAVAILAQVIQDKSPLQALELLSNCTRLLRGEEVAQGILQESIGFAKNLATSVIDSDGGAGATALGGVSGPARDLRTAIRYLGNVAAAEELDFLLECQADPSTAALLGMDALQSLRFSLQRVRADLDAELREQLDEWYIDLLYQAGERLFSLVEDPMDPEEYQSFLAQKDLRYNAASYLDSQFDRDESLRSRLESDPDLCEFLGSLVVARSTDSEGKWGDALYEAVSEKKETRLLCATLLAKMGVDLAETEGGLFPELILALIEEVQAPREALEDAEVFRARGSPSLVLELPIQSMPSDRFLMDQAIRGLRALGYEARAATKVIRIHQAGAPGAQEETGGRSRRGGGRTDGRGR